MVLSLEDLGRGRVEMLDRGVISRSAFHCLVALPQDQLLLFLLLVVLLVLLVGLKERDVDLGR